MKAVITILTMAMAMTALAFPYNARYSNSTETNTLLVPTPTTKLLPPDTTLVSSPTSKLLPPTESAENVHVQIHSTHKVLLTATPAATPSSSSSSNPAPASKSTEDGKVHIIPSLMGSLGLDGVMGSLSSLMTGQ